MPLSRTTWRYRCAAPTEGGRCGQLITNAVCDPIDLGAWADELWHHYAPGPTITHLPCGHQWWRGQGWEPRIERVPWAK
jgi:hypothetical protein